MSNVAVREYRIVRYTSFNEWEGLREAGTDFALHQNANLLNANRPHSTRSARDLKSSVLDVLSKEDIEDALRFMSSIIASAAHGHIFASTYCSSDRSRVPLSS